MLHVLCQLAPQPSQTPGLDAATTNYNNASAAYTDLTSSANTPNEASMLTSAEQAAGTPAMKSTIDQLKVDLATSTAAYNNQYQDIAAKGIQNGVPNVAYQGQQAAQQRQASVVLAGKAAVLSALQGNYTEAEAQATKVADMQFAAAEAKVTNAYNFLKLNADQLTTAQAAQIKAQAADQSAQIADQKVNVKTALSSGVQSAFWTRPDGTVIRTSDGYAFHTPEEAFAAGVLQDFSNAPKINPVGKSETKTLNGRSVHIVYDQAGNVLSQTDLGAAGKVTGDGDGSGGTVSTYVNEGGKMWKVTTKNGVQTSKVEQKATTGTTPPPAKVNVVLNNLTSIAGQDHALSPQDWNDALSQWLDAGYSLASFKSNFGKFATNSTNSNYGSPLNAYNGM